jgi:hypothetical protein
MQSRNNLCNEALKEFLQPMNISFPCVTSLLVCTGISIHSQHLGHELKQQAGAIGGKNQII